MNRKNELVICKEHYDSVEEFENAIRDAIMLLLNAEYVMTVDYDEKGFGIVKIEYGHSNQEFGCAYPYWLYPEEIETVVCKDE